MQGITFKKENRPGGSLWRLNTAPLGKCRERASIRYTCLLRLERVLPVLLRRFADAGNENMVGTGYQHQRPVKFVIVRQHERYTHRAHTRHPVFRMPGFKIRVPVKARTLKADFVVNPALVDVDFAAEQLSYDPQNSGVAGKAVKVL